MLKRPLLAIALALVLAGAFCFGLARLFSLRYQAGEVYPPYSTLRADPLGTKAIFEALSELPGFVVRRNFQPLKKLQPGQPITLVYVGVQPQSYWTDRELQELETLLANGSRVVFAFHPIDFPPPPEDIRREQEKERERKREQVEREDGKPRDGDTAKDGKEDKDATKDGKKKKPGPSAEDAADSGLISFKKVAKRFGFRFDYEPGERDKTYDRHAFLFAAGAPLETDISWHSALHFADLSPDWKPLYLTDNRAVIAERAYGRGSILLASDSFFLSNEALRRERHPLLLSRVFSGPQLIVFDEEHLGVSEQPGVATLVSKYHLQGVVAGLLLVAALFVWKNTARFLPPLTEGGDDGDVVQGHDSAQGFAKLLYRSIKPADLLRVCVEEWRHGAPHSAKNVAIVEELWAQEQSRPAKKRNAAAAYRAIAEALERH
jgi:hypothetical protein